MDQIRSCLIFSHYIRENWEENEIKIDNKTYIISSGLKKRLGLKNLVSYSLAFIFLILSRLFIEPVLRNYLSMTVTWILSFIGAIILIYLVSYFMVPKDLEGDIKLKTKN